MKTTPFKHWKSIEGTITQSNIGLLWEHMNIIVFLEISNTWLVNQKLLIYNAFYKIKTSVK